MYGLNEQTNLRSSSLWITWEECTIGLCQAMKAQEKHVTMRWSRTDRASGRRPVSVKGTTYFTRSFLFELFRGRASDFQKLSLQKCVLGHQEEDKCA